MNKFEIQYLADFACECFATMTQFHQNSNEIQHQNAIKSNRKIKVILFYRYHIKIERFDLNS